MKRNYLDKLILTCVDAGARGGLAELRNFSKYLALFSFEPDETECNNLTSSIYPGCNYQKAISYPLALYSSEGEAALHVSAKPSMSSLLEFDEQAFDSHFGLAAGSARWRNMLRQREVQKVKTITLDKWAEQNKINSIDFLKLDTQGTELEILKGAEHLLASGKINVIKTEFSMMPVYKSQPHFSEIDTHLRNLGYVLVDSLFYPEVLFESGETSINSSIKIKEPPKLAAGGDAVYMLDSKKLNREAAFNTAIILASMGYLTKSYLLLKTNCGINDTEFRELLKIAQAKPARIKIKNLLVSIIPPVVRKIIRRVRNP